MGPVRLQYVISYSSQDEKYPVENLLHKTGQPSGRGWLSSPADKSGHLEAEFQLEKTSYIHYVDIGNCGSSTVEILVGRSSWPRSRNYISLLPAITMMTCSESRSCLNRISVRMFTSDDLNSEAVKMKWDRVRVICNQPYRRDLQFGISFLRFGNKEPEIESPKETSNDALKESINQKFSEKICSRGNLLKSIDTFDSRSLLQRLSPSYTLSRSYSILNAATNMKSPLPSQSSQNSRTQFDEAALETDFVLFLTSKESAHFADSFDDCLQEYEELSGVELTIQQAQVFQHVYESVFRRENLSPTEAVASSPFVPARAFYSAYPRVKRKRNGIPDFPTDEDGNQLSFDLNFVPKKHSKQHSDKVLLNGHAKQICNQEVDSLPVIDLESPAKKRKSGTSFLNTQQESSSMPLITIEDEAECSSSSQSHLTSECSGEEFVQFDGSKPGSSKEVTYVDCPICNEPFHVQEIERHAATCEKYHSDDSDNENDGSTSSSKVVPVGCHSEKYLECPVCGNMFQKTALPLHANVCIENCLA